MNLEISEINLQTSIVIRDYKYQWEMTYYRSILYEYTIFQVRPNLMLGGAEINGTSSV
jgi:hypothetical protein